MANILVVDDDFDMADVCADVLRSEGHDVRLARNGEEGLARIDEQIPDLIVCDVEMPVLAGPDMACRIFLVDAGRERVPVLLVSGVQDLKSVAEKVGTPYFLAKPFTVERLFEMVARALAERVAPQPDFSKQ